MSLKITKLRNRKKSMYHLILFVPCSEKRQTPDHCFPGGGRGARQSATRGGSEEEIVKGQEGTFGVMIYAHYFD
jgi:hypothetical protein